ncbi:hypothetical protein [Leptolyngbya sp. GGD]|uniref:hypothetical protein n=1 Tax=Leptolyngbya sp. GGD TaxID=2997907 RepID=UPI00227A4F27|nr:hypothetical protein [Leptolyngbya sp. GGD]MCY6493178.1 hypothetical protein [Leptolyngbya sp. GGD]
MQLDEIQDQALKLSPEERLKLANVLMRSLQPTPRPVTKRQEIAERLIGMAQTDAPPPSDEEVAAMLDERLAQKYL